MNKGLKLLQIETTNLCNSHCIFCPRERMKKFGTMSDKLFKKILCDAKEVTTLKTICPMLNGEPFMDKKFLSRLRLINEVLPLMNLVVFTNCSLVTKEVVEELKDIDNLKMVFSLNGNCTETREKLMGLSDYEKALSMIYDYSSFEKPFKVAFVAHPSVSEEELNRFGLKWGSLSMFITPSDFGGKNFKPELPKLFCKRAISEMTVLWDGRVCLCCADSFGEEIFGDLNNQTVKGVWESEERQRFVKAHFDGEVLKGTLCERCGGI